MGVVEFPLPQDTAVQTERFLLKANVGIRRIWLWYIVAGIKGGLISGAVAGTFAFPLIGTAFGAFGGLTNGALLGLVLGGFVGRAIMRSADGVQALRSAAVVSALGAWSIFSIFSGLLIFADGFSFLSWLIGYLLVAVPLLAAAAWGGAYALRKVVTEAAVADINSGVFGKYVTMTNLLVLSAVVPVVGWLCVLVVNLVSP